MFNCFKKKKIINKQIIEDKIENKEDKEDKQEIIGEEITIGKEFLHGFRIIHKLPCSNNKLVYIVQNQKKLEEKYVLKIKNELTKYEAQVYSRLVNKTHPNVQHVIMFYKSQDKYCFIYEYIDGYDLYEYADKIGGLLENEIKHIIREVSKGLQFLHDNNIIHLDIKEENILYNPVTGNVKIIDFDLSLIFNDDTKKVIHTLAGTEHYVAPESISHSIYSPKTDTWQLGVVLYILTVGVVPCTDVLKHKCSDNCIKRMFNNLENSIVNNKFNPSLYTLLCNMLNRSETERYNLNQILNSEWLNK